MPSTNESNLGLSLGWTLGEDDWNTGMDANIAILGAMSNLSVKSRTTKVKPVSPADGDRYYIPTTATGVWADYKKNIAVYSAFHSDWFYIPIKYGMEFRIQNESNRLVFYNGTSLVSSNTGEEGWEFDPTAQQTITGEWAFDISGGKSFIVSDDPTMVAPTNIIGIADHVAAIPTGAVVLINTINPTGGNSSSYSTLLNDDGSVERYFNIGNAVDDVADATMLNAAGVSSRTITVDTLTINATQQHVGLKVGTLASPPAGMVAGEVWLDTTDSSNYPIYRGYIP